MNSFTFHEQIQHGTLDFPFEYHYVTPIHPRYNMPFHWHKEWEIIHIIEGNFAVSTDHDIYTAYSGDILLIRDGMLHGGTPENCTYECFLFDLHRLFGNLDMVKQYLRPFYRQQILPDVYYPAAQIPEIDRAIAAMADVYHDSNSTDPLHNPLELVVLGCISQIFATILQKKTYSTNQTATVENTHKIDLIKTILEYIENNYASPVTLDELADIANMNSKYFCRFFRSITHQTPIDYLNMYRIEKAAQMLHSTRLPITEICMECGFNDSSNFIKVFRRYKGMTPKQYRNG